MAGIVGGTWAAGLAFSVDPAALTARLCHQAPSWDDRISLPPRSTSPSLQNLLTRIALAVAEAASEQHKLLRDAVVVRITVESRAVIKPYFFVPTVVRLPLRRRRMGTNPPEQGRCSHRF
jgi:hypothetical protein